MSLPVLQIDGLAKQYRLGPVGTGTLSHDLNRLWHRLRGKPDPYTRVTATTNRADTSNAYVWALREIDTEICQGETVGVIGHNGAGKSTLLKILSRITAPTSGTARIKGRVGSLLEIGTGFHLELTGRENIFLNGAILGMTTADVSARMDQIIAFFGHETYIDTPVKRYSSGMMVRLAFAVAAHLDPDILIVDEVLAVGDLQFQRKCLGRMQDVARDGRTVLFVSHNMNAVSQLCSRTLVLHEGRLVFDGETAKAVAHYRSLQGLVPISVANARVSPEAFTSDGDCRLTSIELLDATQAPLRHLATGDALCIRVHYALGRPLASPSFALRFLTEDRQPLMRLVSDACGYAVDALPAGKGFVDCHIPRLPLMRGPVVLDAALEVRGSDVLHSVIGAIRFEIAEGDFYGSGVSFDSARLDGVLLCDHAWRYGNTPESGA